MQIKFITNEKNWLEDEAVQQLNAVSAYRGVEAICAMPDLHPGRTPVGAAILTRGVIYPHLIGSDIGCGMSFYKLAVKAHKLKSDRISRGAESMLAERPNHDFGTIGSGNHFAELQQIEKLLDEQLAARYELAKDSACLLVHSGSRAYGYEIFARALEKSGLVKGYDQGSEDFAAYMQQHQRAMTKASKNRDRIAERLCDFGGIKGELNKLCESVHNHVVSYPQVGPDAFLHRKGASEAIAQLVIIPGSRDSLSYLVQPLAPCEQTFYTLAHGAGRKWNRKFCQSRLADRYAPNSTVTKKYRSKLVYREKECVFEEAPECYKNIDNVVDIMCDQGLLKIVATLKPLLTVKG